MEQKHNLIEYAINEIKRHVLLHFANTFVQKTHIDE